MRYGMICGSGRFPILALETARRQGDEVVAVCIEGVAPKEIEALAHRSYWIALGALSRLIEILKQEGVDEVILCGQVKHVSIFSSIRPDWRLLKLLTSLRSKNTDALLGGVMKILEDEGIRMGDSTRLLKPMMADEGAMTKRKPDADEARDVGYGRSIANALSAFDIGQSVAIADGACVAVEAMEGTDAMLRRAASLVNGKPLRLVKAARRRKHLRFDVPVAGLDTIAAMRETGATVLAVDAGRTLLLDRERMIEEANSARICIVGHAAEE